MRKVRPALRVPLPAVHLEPDSKRVGQEVAAVCHCHPRLDSHHLEDDMPKSKSQSARKFLKSSGIRKNRSTALPNLPTTSEDLHRLGQEVMILERGARQYDYEAVQKVAVAAAALMASEELWAEEIKKPIWKRVLRSKRPKLSDRAQALRFLMRLHRNGDSRAASIRSLAVEYIWEDGRSAHHVAAELEAWRGYEKIEQARVRDAEEAQSGIVSEEADASPPFAGLINSKPTTDGDSDFLGDSITEEVNESSASQVHRSEDGWAVSSELPFDLTHSLVASVRCDLLANLREILSSDGASFIIKVTNTGKTPSGWTNVEVTAIAPDRH